MVSVYAFPNTPHLSSFPRAAFETVFLELPLKQFHSSSVDDGPLSSFQGRSFSVSSSVHASLLQATDRPSNKSLFGGKIAFCCWWWSRGGDACFGFVCCCCCVFFLFFVFWGGEKWGGAGLPASVRTHSVRACVCVRARVRACVRACVCVCVKEREIVRERERDKIILYYTGIKI